MNSIGTTSRNENGTGFQHENGTGVLHENGTGLPGAGDGGAAASPYDTPLPPDLALRVAAAPVARYLASRLRASGLSVSVASAPDTDSGGMAHLLLVGGTSRLFEREAEREEIWLPLRPETVGGVGAVVRPLSEQGWPSRRFSVAARDEFAAAGATGVTFSPAERAGLLSTVLLGVTADGGLPAALAAAGAGSATLPRHLHSLVRALEAVGQVEYLGPLHTAGRCDGWWGSVARLRALRWSCVADIQATLPPLPSAPSPPPSLPACLPAPCPGCGETATGCRPLLSRLPGTGDSRLLGRAGGLLLRVAVLLPAGCNRT